METSFGSVVVFLTVSLLLNRRVFAQLGCQSEEENLHFVYRKVILEQIS